jgi:hypothetical protein
MDQATDRIEQHIDDERRMLRSNLEELEDRVRSVVDWRRQFRSNPGMMLGIALAGGLLIGLIARGGRARVLRARDYPRAGEPAGPASDHRRRQISLAWRGIESALIGVAAARLKDTLARVLLGFSDSGRPGASSRYRS